MEFISKTGSNEPPGQSLDDADEKWKTYKDFMRRKRDYKREWRKRRLQQQKPLKEIQKRQKPINVQQINRPQRIPSPDDFTPSLEINPSRFVNEGEFIEEVYHIEEDQEEGEEEFSFHLEEEVPIIPEPPLSVDDDEEDIIEYNNRSKLVFERLDGLLPRTRLHILSILEGLIDEEEAVSQVRGHNNRIAKA